MGRSDQLPAEKEIPLGPDSFYTLKTASLLEIKREPGQLLQPGELCEGWTCVLCVFASCSALPLEGLMGSG